MDVHDVNAKAPSQIEPTLGGASGGMVSVLLVLPPQITHAQAGGCLHMLLAAVHAESSGAAGIVVDAAPLTQFDSSALAVLIECRREALQNGKRFTVRNMPARLAELARLYGVAQLMGKGAAAS